MTFPFLLPRNTSRFHNEKAKICFSRITIANARITILNLNFRKIKFWLKFLCRRSDLQIFEFLVVCKWDTIKMNETKYIMIIFIYILIKTKNFDQIFSIIIKKKPKMDRTCRKNALKHRNHFQICYKINSHLTYNWIVIVTILLLSWVR